MSVERVFLQVDDLYNRHVAVDAARIVAFHSIGDSGAEIVMDNGWTVQVKHRVSDLLNRLDLAVRAAARATEDVTP